MRLHPVTAADCLGCGLAELTFIAEEGRGDVYGCLACDAVHLHRREHPAGSACGLQLYVPQAQTQPDGTFEVASCGPMPDRTWEVYIGDREAARAAGDPLLGTVVARSRAAALRAAGAAGLHAAAPGAGLTARPAPGER